VCTRSARVCCHVSFQVRGSTNLCPPDAWKRRYRDSRGQRESPIRTGKRGSMRESLRITAKERVEYEGSCSLARVIYRPCCLGAVCPIPSQFACNRTLARNGAYLSTVLEQAINAPCVWVCEWESTPPRLDFLCFPHTHMQLSGADAPTVWFARLRHHVNTRQFCKHNLD